MNLIKPNVKGIQYVSTIDSNSLIFSSDSANLQYFYEPKPNQLQKWNPEWLGYEVVNNINDDTLNSNYNYSVEKEPSVFRIITMGDSFTYGHYVKTDENYTSILEKRLNSELRCADIKKFEIINFGVPGYDIAYMVERYKKRGLKYKPDLVMWLINNWNFQKINEILIPHVTELKKLASKTNFIDPNYIVERQAISNINKKYGSALILDYQKAELIKFKDVYKGNLLFISYNSMENEYKKIIWNYLDSQTNFKYFDNLFNTHLNEKYHFLDYHPNIEGHKELSKDIYNYLIANYFSYCKLI